MTRRDVRPLILVLVVATLGALPHATAGESGIVVVCDFESGEPTDTWEIGGLGVADITIESGATPSGGRGLKMIGKGRKGSIRRPVEVRDWQTFRALSLFAAVESAGRIEMRILALSGRGPAAMLKRFSLEPGPWREIVLPLDTWHEDIQEQIGDFSHVETIVVQWDEGEGEVSLDDLRLLPGKKGEASSRITRRQFLELAFPAGDERAYQNDGFLLATNAPELTAENAKRVLARCEETCALLTSRYRLPGRRMDRVPMVIFETKEEYRLFIQRLGTHYGLKVNPGDNSTSVLGICASFYHPKYGWDRPTFTYLAASGVIRRLLGIGTTSNWILVGLASAAQIRLHPSAMPDDFVQKQIQGYVDGPRTRFRPLQELLDPETSTGRYRGQLASLMEFLAEARAEDLPRFWERVLTFREPVATLGRAALLETLETDIDSLEDAYVEWGYDWLPER